MGSYRFKKRFGFSLLELTLASAIAGVLIAGAFSWHLKLSYFYKIKQHHLTQLNEQLFARYYFWSQLVKAGYAGRLSLSQLHLNLVSKVYDRGVHAFSFNRLPQALVLRKATSDVLELAYTLDTFLQLRRDFNPSKVEAVAASYFKAPAAWRRYTHVLVEDGLNSEVARLGPEGLQISDLRHSHAKADTRIYPLCKVQFFVAELPGRSKALYRVLNYEPQVKLFNLEDFRVLGGLTSARGGEGARGGNEGDISTNIIAGESNNASIEGSLGSAPTFHYPAAYLSECGLWDQVVVIKLELSFKDTPKPLEIFARLRNIHESSSF